jgi:hypothetical protein
MLLISGSASGSALPAPSRQPSASALGDIPAHLLTVYREAASETCGMRWEVLAAVGKVETDHGRSTLPGVTSGENFAGAKGPMQFLQATWNAYGVDGDHDGDTDVYDPVDAIWGAANYLCANGAGSGREQDALWHYNHSSAYVDDVLSIAAGYAEPAAAGSVSSVDTQALLDNPRLSLSPNARQDIVDGVIDARVTDFLAWAIQNHDVTVSVLKTGHSQYVAGTDRISNHYRGQAVDIFAVDGEVVTSSSDAARRLAIEATDLNAGRPDETGLPWSDLTDRPGVFTDADHTDHLHFGWR